MENSDRRSLTLEQEGLIKDVYAANPRTVVVLLSDFPYALNWTNDHVPAIIQMSQNAQEAGAAIADVLFGDYNPGGRLVVTLAEASLDQLPPMLDYNLRHGRTYMYFQGEPLYPFGYGLSYTTFGYTNLKSSSITMRRDGEVTVSVDVENTGDRAGDEVVQMCMSGTKDRKCIGPSRNYVDLSASRLRHTRPKRFTSSSRRPRFHTGTSMLDVLSWRKNRFEFWWVVRRWTNV